MEEVALYRKYRPGKFKEVVGQEHVVKALDGAVKQGNISHAYLFSGSRGTGKTSLARIFAREIGCSQNDLYEIDAASNRGIDDVRELKESVNTLPFESPYKVYIIDEVHMLTKEAFNALLKTLEEPPKHAVFILATTEINKLPDTVVSRCQTFVFKKPTRKILKDVVLDIAKKEGFSLEPASAELIAILGDGSFRDTQGVLQKIIGCSKDKKISHKEIEAITGAPKSELVNSLVSAIAKKDLAGGLKIANEVVGENLDMKIFLKMALAKLRAVLLLKFAPDMEALVREENSAEDFEFLREMSLEKDANINSRVISEMLDAYDMSGKSFISQLPLELALVKILGQDK